MVRMVMFVVMMMSMMKVRRSITMTVMVTLSTCPPCSFFSGCPSDPDSSPLARPKCHSLLFFCHCHNHPQSYIGHLGHNDILRHFWQISLSHLQRAILETFDLWDTDYNVDNWEPEFMTIKSDTGQYSQFLWRFIKEISQVLKRVKPALPPSDLPGCALVAFFRCFSFDSCLAACTLYILMMQFQQLWRNFKIHSAFHWCKIFHPHLYSSVTCLGRRTSPRKWETVMAQFTEYSGYQTISADQVYVG